MEKILTQRNIATRPSNVHRAITTTEGLRGWWTGDCEVQGNQAHFRFNKDGGVMELEFRIDAVEPDRVEWTCVGQRNNPDWQGTRVTFHLSPTHDGTRLDFAHTDWQEKGKVYEMCVAGWDHFMNSLKAYAETGRGMPFGGQA